MGCAVKHDGKDLVLCQRRGSRMRARICPVSKKGFKNEGQDLVLCQKRGSRMRFGILLEHIARAHAIVKATCDFLFTAYNRSGEKSEPVFKFTLIDILTDHSVDYKYTFQTPSSDAEFCCRVKFLEGNIAVLPLTGSLNRIDL